MTSQTPGRRAPRRGRAGARRRDDEGSATVLVLALSGLLAVVAALAAAIGAVAVARHRAAAAADLAALAAADRALDGERVACQAAGAATRAAGAVLTGCRVSGDIADVDVVVRPPGVLGSWGEAQARARAGPSSLPRDPTNVPGQGTRTRSVRLVAPRL